MQQDELFTYYVSRGISENILLDQVLWKNVRPKNYAKQS